jgi:hypothetical protein
MLDASQLAALLSVMVTDDIHYKEFVLLRGHTAQAFSDLLRTVCESFLFVPFQRSIDMRSL